MGTSVPMRRVGKLGKFQLFRADKHFLYPGLHLWTGRRHRQVWPPTFRSFD